MRTISRVALIIIAVNIGASLVMTGVCSGPIDQIFIGWRDLSACYSYFGGCIVGGNQDNDEIGVILLTLFLCLFVAAYFIFKLIVSFCLPAFKRDAPSARPLTLR
jgi:hypothetical protein